MFQASKKTNRNWKKKYSHWFNWTEILLSGTTITQDDEKIDQTQKWILILFSSYVDSAESDGNSQGENPMTNDF